MKLWENNYLIRWVFSLSFIRIGQKLWIFYLGTQISKLPFYKILTLTLFVTGGALNAPTIKNRSAISPWAMLGSPKLLTLFLSVLDIFQQSSFSNFQSLKKISNVVKNIQRGDPSMQKSKFSKKNFFIWRTLYFLPEFELYMISAFFWGTYLICSTKFQIFVIFSMKFSILTFPVSMAIATKLHYLEDYFWCLWKGKDLNFHMKANFWLFEAIPQCYHVKTRSGP